MRRLLDRAGLVITAALIFLVLSWLGPWSYTPTTWWDEPQEEQEQ